MICDFWLSVKDHEGYLMVSASGDIHSLDRTIYRSDTGKGVLYRGMPIIPQTDKRGYPRIRTSFNGSKRSIRIHRIVAEAFINNPENKKQVNHIDGVKTNNKLSNLEWSTNSENQKHAYDTGLKKQNFGVEASAFKSKISVYKDGEHLYDLAGSKELIEYGYSPQNVSAVILGKRTTHMGCTFKRN